MSNKKDTQKQLQIWEKTLHSILVNIKEHLSMFSFFWFRPYSSRVFFWHFFEFFQDFQSAGQNSKSRMEFSFRFIKLGIFGNLTCPTFSFILICPLISPPLLNFLMLKLKICQKLEKFMLRTFTCYTGLRGIFFLSTYVEYIVKMNQKMPKKWGNSYSFGR